MAVDWEPLWEEFIEKARVRMEKGAQEYGDLSFSAEPVKLLGEIEEELLDTVNWCAILAIRLRKLESLLKDGD